MPLYLGDSRRKLKSLPSNSVDVVVSSPPYKDSDGFDESLIIDVFREVYRLQRDDTFLFLNFGALAEDKFRPFRTCQLLMGLGYQLNDTITWVKNHFRPIQGNTRLNNLTEFIFVLYKGNLPAMNRLAVGVPYADKSNVKRFNRGLDLRCGGNIWHIDYETVQTKEQKLHNDRFPIELPLRCIKLCGYDVNTVLDPFSGSGTTCVAAKQLGKDFIGIEKCPEHHEVAKARLKLVKVLPKANHFEELFGT
jgi:site-specific DNA-methyltransferase (adenine-specific)